MLFRICRDCFFSCFCMKILLELISWVVSFYWIIVLKLFSFRYVNYPVSVLQHIKKLLATWLWHRQAFPFVLQTKMKLIATIQLSAGVGRYGLHPWSSADWVGSSDSKRWGTYKITINNSRKIRNALGVKLKTGWGRSGTYKPAQTVSVVCYYHAYFNPVDVGLFWRC